MVVHLKRKLRAGIDRIKADSNEALHGDRSSHMFVLMNLAFRSSCFFEACGDVFLIEMKHVMLLKWNLVFL